MGRRTTMAWAVALVLGTAPAGCTMSFPSADQSHVFACHQDSDCASGYMCGADRKCDVPSEAGGDGGTTGTDGGTTGTDGGTSGTDGGTSGTDGGTSGTDGGTPPQCDTRIALSPSTVNDHDGFGVAFYLPAGVQPQRVRVDGNLTPNPTPIASGNLAFNGWSVPVQVSTSLPTATFRVDVTGGGCFAGNLRVVHQPHTVTVTPKAVGAGGATPIAVHFPAGSTLQPGEAAWVYLVDQSGTLHAMGDAMVTGANTVAAPVVGVGHGSYGAVAIVGGQSPLLGVAARPALEVSADGVPRIVRVSPVHIPKGATNVPVTITVSNAPGEPALAQGAEVQLVCGSQVDTPQAIPTGGQMDTVTLDAPSAGEGTPCVLAYQDTTPGGNTLTTQFPGLSISGSGAAAWTTAMVKLGTARQDPGAAVVTAADGTRYLVVVGGSDGTAALRTTEYAPLDDRGAPQQFSPGPLLPTAPGVWAPAVVSLSNTIFVLGGFAAQGVATKSVYRAELRNPREHPTGLGTDLSVGSGYTKTQPTTFFYTVTADISDPDRGTFETVAAPPVRAEIPPQVPVTVVLHWAQQPGAVGYEIYRGTTPNISQMDHIQSIKDNNTLQFDDLGAPTLDGSRPPPPDTLTPWKAQSQALTGPRAAAGAVVIPDDQGGGVIVVGGGNDGTQDLASVEVGDLTAQTPPLRLQVFKSLGSNVLSQARQGLDARVVDRHWTPGAGNLGGYVIFGPGASSTTAQPIVEWGAYAGGALTLTSGNAPPMRDGLHLFTGAGLVDVLGVDENTAPATSSDVQLPMPITGSTLTVTASGSVGPILTSLARHRGSAEANGLCYLVGGGGSDGTTVLWTIR